MLTDHPTQLTDHSTQACIDAINYLAHAMDHSARAHIGNVSSSHPHPGAFAYNLAFDLITSLRCMSCTLDRARVVAALGNALIDEGIQTFGADEYGVTIHETRYEPESDKEVSQ